MDEVIMTRNYQNHILVYKAYNRPRETLKCSLTVAISNDKVGKIIHLQLVSYGLGSTLIDTIPSLFLNLGVFALLSSIGLLLHTNKYTVAHNRDIGLWSIIVLVDQVTCRAVFV